MCAKVREQEALDYHALPKPGKVEVVSPKSCLTQRDLSLAYTPGVAVPCLHIHKRPEDAFKYTSKGNLVAVVSNGTAVLGLGDIGALAGKPVMEGKGVLFKRFANIDVFDIELETHNADEIIKCVKLMEPTFGGINLEDIKAPECFYIEEKLIEMMNIPVFHDDQHGTAIISGAAMVNALEIAEKDIDKVRLVVCGAGAAGIACAKMFVALGVTKENVMLLDTKGVVYKGRTEGMNPYKEFWAVDTDRRTLADAMEGADVFVGVSGKDLVSQDMVRSMAKNAHHLRHGQSGPGNHLRRGQGRPQRRHHGHRPVRLPEPGQQRPRLPLHLPGRPGRARHQDQRADEAGRVHGPGQAGQGGRARCRHQGLRREQVPVRHRVHHPEAVRPARAAVGGAGRRPGGHRLGRGHPAVRRHRALPLPAGVDAGPVQGPDARRDQQGQAPAQEDHLPRGRGGADPAVLPDRRGRGHRHAGAARQQRGHPQQDRPARPRPAELRDRRSADGRAGRGIRHEVL